MMLRRIICQDVRDWLIRALLLQVLWTTTVKGIGTYNYIEASGHQLGQAHSYIVGLLWSVRLPHLACNIRMIKQPGYILVWPDPLAQALQVSALRSGAYI